MALHTHLNDQGATLTTNHAASSYGQPVLVLNDGSQAYGPGDLPAGTILVIDELFCDHLPETEDFHAEVAAARAAGFNVAKTSNE
jgi:hypothetical protein